MQDAQASVAKLKAEQAMLAETKSRCRAQLEAFSQTSDSAAAALHLDRPAQQLLQETVTFPLLSQ